MRGHRALLIAGFSLAAVLPLTVPACDSNGGGGPSNALFASWNATSFMAQGTDYIAGGMVLVMTFQSGGTYVLDVTNDLIGACDPGPDCSNTGTFTRSGNQLTLDPGSADEVTFVYAISGKTLTLTGSIGGISAAIVLEKV
jgi:hypothetical protein